MKSTATRWTSSLGIILMLSAGGVAYPAEVGGSGGSQPYYELTGYVGYQSGEGFNVEGSDEQVDVPGHVSYAVALNFRAESEGQYQVFYSRQPAHVDSSSVVPSGMDVDIDYVHFGGTLRLKPGSTLEPYIVGSLGATLLSPDFPGADNDQAFSIGFGGGLRIPVTQRFNLLFEARAFVSFVSSGGSLFCSSGDAGGACRLQGSGSTFTQYVVMLGASFPF